MSSSFGRFAEFERAMVRERTQAGLETARKQGRIGGRKLLVYRRSAMLQALTVVRDSFFVAYL